MDPALIPPYLRPHILPPIRKVFFDDPTPGASTSTASPSVASTPTSDSSPTLAAELARATAELAALQQQCATWRRRAEVHAAANNSLLSFARAAKDCALRLRTERDAERTRCVLLKRKLGELVPDLDPETESIFTERRLLTKGAAAVPRMGLPVFLMQCRPPEHYYDNPADMESSHFGPPMKRRRRESGGAHVETTAPVTAAAVKSDAAVTVAVGTELAPAPALPGSASALPSSRLPTLGAR